MAGRGRTNPPRRTTADGSRLLSAYLDNADVFRTAKGGGKKPNQPAVLVLQRRPDFDKRDFNRKARDLQRLSNQGKLKKAKPNRPASYKSPLDGKMKGLAGWKRDRGIVDKLKNKEKNKEIIDKLFAGKRGVTHRGQALDADHIHDLGLDGPDSLSNLRWMDAWTNREMGREIGQALKDVPPGTPVIIKIL
jgi:hypothetical protein